MYILCKTRLLLCNHIILTAIVMLSVISIPTYAQTTSRTTPVEVKNPVAIDKSSNTVNAQQSGTWNVGISGTPGVNVLNTPGVIITNTPNVNLANSPTVLIDAKCNSVMASTQSSAEKLWSENKFVAPYDYLWSNTISCKGYKEAKVIIKLGPYMNDLSKVYVNVYVYTPDGLRTLLGKTAFSTPAQRSATQGSLEYNADSCIFTVPVMSDAMAIEIYNGDTRQLPIYSIHSWVYLVN